MSESNKYGEPWVKEHSPYDWSAADRKGREVFRVVRPGLDVTQTDIRDRIVKCINLLHLVPDAAKCFLPEGHWPDEVHLALAVLRGEFGAAAALADEVVANHLRDPAALPEAVKEVSAALDRHYGLVTLQPDERCNHTWRWTARDGYELGIYQCTVCGFEQTEVPNSAIILHHEN